MTFNMTVEIYKRGAYSDELKIPVVELKEIMSLIYTFICISACISSAYTINTCKKDGCRH